MRWSLKIGRVAGIAIRIHFTFLLFLGWIGFVYYERGGGSAALQGIAFIVALFACVLLHEFGHASVARAFGILTPDITLLPIGGVARLQRMPDKPWQELVVAIAGPLVNVVIAAVLIAVIGHRADFNHWERMQMPQIDLVSKLALVNVWLVLFNLIPAFPMDGGRILRSLLAMVMNYARATQIAAWIGQGLAIVFGFVGLFTNPMLIFIALFVYLGAQQEAAMAQMKCISQKVPVADAMVSQVVALPREASLNDAMQLLLRTSQRELPVVDRSSQVLGLLTRPEMIAALKQGGAAASVGEVMRHDIPSVRPDDTCEEAVRLMQEHAVPALPVVDARGHLLGLVTTENVGELMLVNSFQPHDGHPGWRHSNATSTP